MGVGSILVAVYQKKNSPRRTFTLISVLSIVFLSAPRRTLVKIRRTCPKFLEFLGYTVVAVLPSSQDMKTIALRLHKHEYSWVVIIRNSGHNTPLGHDTDHGPTVTGLGQYEGLGEYCGPHTASSVLLTLIFFCYFT